MSEERTTVNYRVGEEYPFIVNTIHDDFCELLDESNFRVYLQHTNGYSLVKGQKITCRVLAYTQKRPRIALANADILNADNSKIDEKAIAEILKECEIAWDGHEFARLLLMVERDSSFEDECRRWIATLNEGGANIEAVRTDCTMFMEQSTFLSKCNTNERGIYQQRLSLLIELFGYYIRANKLIADGEDGIFVDQLFEKLRLSGYVYQPARNFNVLSCLFLRNKALMEARIGELFDILRRWEVDMWRKEPFNSVLKKVVQLYIDENVWDVDKVRDNTTLLRNLTQALTIQLLLTDRNAEADLFRLNLSRLCTLVTYSYLPEPKRTMNLALYNLLATQVQMLPYALAETATASVAYRMGNVSPKTIDTTSCYIHGRAKLVVDGKGITLYSSTDGQPKAVLPESLGLWRHLQVMVDKKSVKTLTSSATIMDCKQLWTDVEQDIFASKPTKGGITEWRKTHKVGDTVQIAVTYQDDRIPAMFHCRISDDIGGDGVIFLRDIVPYTVTARIDHFRSAAGRSLLLTARIVEKDGNRYRFSMLDEIKDWTCEYYGDDEEFECSLGSNRPLPGRRIPAVTREGISVSLGGFDEMEPDELVKGDVVAAVFQRRGDGTFHICGKATSRALNQYYDLSESFHKLMELHADGAEEEPTTVEDTDFEQNDRLLDVAYVKELVRIVDRMAVIDSEYIKSYNYLGFARVLCRMIGWDEQASYYRGRMELIVLLHDFAINDVVDENRLNSLEDMNADIFQNNTLLRNRYLQLQTVSCMGKDDRDEQLWQAYAQGVGVVKDVASLVIAYNMVRRNGMTAQGNDIQNRIKQVLRLEGYESNLKIYGTGVEDKVTEYKTSIVFPPAENMYPNMAVQMKNVMSVIASFLNTDGGTLFIGANDSGSGVGIANDLAYKEFNGDKDKYQRTISDAVALAWGNAVATYVDVAYDKANTDKDVVVVTVRPYADGVKYDDYWWVRTASSKRRLTKSEFEQYNIARRELHREAEEMLQTAPTEAADAPAAVAASPVETSVYTVAATTAGETIPTATRRRNILESYRDGYVPYDACLKILDKGKFCKVSDYDYESGLLTLAVYDDEKNGYLILGYADGTVAKVAVRKLLEYDDYKTYARSTASPLLFATIANDADAIVSITREAKGKGRLMVRMDTVARIEEVKIADKGCRLYNEGIAGAVVGYDWVAADSLSPFKNMLDRDAKTLGQSLDALTDELRAQLGEWITL